MKKYAILSIVLFLTTYKSIACDACGCAMTTAIQPTDRLTFFGLNYRTSFFSGLHSEHFGESFFIKEQFSRVDLQAKITLKQRFEIIASLPYIQTSIKNADASPILYKGIGDLNLMGRYALINHFGKKIDVRVSVGGGVELPTGQYQVKDDDGSVSHVYQTGSGSVNYLAMLSGGLRNLKYGMTFNAAYRYNGTNDLGYHRGNGTTLNLEFFKDMYVKKFRLLPKANLSLENNQRNRLSGIAYTNNTARSFVYTGLGIDTYYKNIMLSVSSQLPVCQTTTYSQLKNKSRIQVSLNYIFNR